MRIESLNVAQLRQLYKTEVETTFPPEELKPLHSMEKLMNEGRYAALCFFDTAGFVGYALLWMENATGPVLLDYLAVTAARRGGGLGAVLLRELSVYLDGRGILLEAEAPDGGPADELRQHRLDFYLRCGAKYLPYDCALFGVHYRCLVMNWAGAEPTAAMELHEKLYRHHLTPEMYAGNVRIPLLPGEVPPLTVVWNEI